MAFAVHAERFTRNAVQPGVRTAPQQTRRVPQRVFTSGPRVLVVVGAELAVCRQVGNAAFRRAFRRTRVQTRSAAG